jgi:hypothetical protein
MVESNGSIGKEEGTQRSYYPNYTLFTLIFIFLIEGGFEVKLD